MEKDGKFWFSFIIGSIIAIPLLKYFIAFMLYIVWWGESWDIINNVAWVISVVVWPPYYYYVRKIKAEEKIVIEKVYRESARYIPTHVKKLVWDRDKGRCVMCGATEYLEYDHIIPVSKGGSNTVNNVQLLCARCNRSKSDKII